MAGIGGPEPRWIRIHRADLLVHDGRRVLEVDGVVERLAHLGLAVDPDQPRHAPHQPLRLGEHLFELPVEAARHLTGELDVGKLVLPDRDQVGSGDENVRHLHDRIGEECHRHGLPAELLHLRLQRRIALEHAERQQPAQPQGEFSVFRDQALDDEGAALRIESDCKPVERHLPHRLPHPRHVVGVVGHLIVGDQETTVVGGLQAHPVLERAGIMAEMQGAGRPDPSQYPLLAFHSEDPHTERDVAAPM